MSRYNDAMPEALLDTPQPGPRGLFETTRWSLVLAAQDAETGRGRQALDELCRIYRHPLYCFVRRAGYQRADAEDLIQGFFARLMARDFFGQATEGRGRMRGFLVSSLRYYLRDAERRAAAQRRGGQVEFVPLDLAVAEQQFASVKADAGSPEECLDRAWALEVVRLALVAVHEQWRRRDRAELFDALRPYLLASLDGETAREIAARYHLSEENVKTLRHRLQKDFGAQLRQIVSETVESEEFIAGEIAALKAALV
jgi:RNA polymerase sigma factor (sigma-70 family)